MLYKVSVASLARSSLAFSRFSALGICIYTLRVAR